MLKGWKTLIFSALIALLGVATQFDWTSVVNAKDAGIILMVVGAIGAVLRVFTDTPVGQGMIKTVTGKMLPSIVALFIAAPLILFMLSGCSSQIGCWLSGCYSASQTELNQIAEGTTIGNDAIQLISANCVQSVPVGVWVGVCSKKTQIKQAADAYVAAVGSVDALVKTQNATPAAVGALIAALAQDAAVIASIESGGASGPRKLGVCVITLQPDGGIAVSNCPQGVKPGISAVDVTYIIQIITQIIPVAVEVFQQIQALIASSPTISTIDGLYAAAQADVAPIDSW